MATSSSDISSATGNSADTVGTSYVNDAKTLQKLATLARTNPTAAAKIGQVLGSKQATAAGAPPASETDLDRYTQNLMRTLFAAELKVHKSVSGASGSAASGISKLNATISKDIRGIKDQIHEALAPVSSATGQSIGNLTGVLKDPLGAPAAIGKSMAHLIDKVNPGFSDRIEASMKKMKADDLQHLGTNVLGGIRSLASTVDALLSVPLSIASDIYNGLMDIMKELSTLLDTVVSGIMDLIFGPKGLLDSLVPMDAIMGFLSTVSEIAGVVGNIGGTFSGLTMVTGVASQLGSYSSMGMSALNNPASLATSMLPIGSTQFTSGLRNPQQLVSQLIPPSLNQQLGKISSLPGLGFVGNMGYNIGGTLESMQGGILTGIVDKYSSQMGVLGSQLGKPSNNKPATDLTAAHPPTIKPASTNPNIPTVQGVPVDLKPAPLVLAQKGNSSVLDASTLSPIANLTAPNDTFNYNTNKNLTNEAISLLKL